MASRAARPVSAVYFRTEFLIPNLHCPTCVDQITQLMRELDPPPVVQSISIVNHVATILHERSLSASTISNLLASAGFEVFDVVLDAASDEQLSFVAADETHFDKAVQKWDPQRPQVDSSARLQHDFHCQMCAAYSGQSKESDFATTIDSIDSTPSYLAILSIDGMTCSSCVGNVTKALEGLPEVTRASVALVNHSAQVQFTANDPDTAVKTLIEAVEDAGYDASLIESKLLPVTRDPAVKDATEDVWEARYTIDGMTCSSCVGNITNAIKALDFVQRVDINLATHSGTVRFRGKGHEPLIQAAIDDAGYDVVSSETTSLAPQSSTSARTVSIQVSGMHCPHCPPNILDAVHKLDVQIIRPISLHSPVLVLSYTPEAPSWTIRTILDTISELDKSFAVTIHKPVSVEQRSREMMRRERKGIFFRALLAFIVAIPTLIIGVVFMDLVSHNTPGYIYLMQLLHGVSRAEWAMFIMATPVYFFAADHFHRRTLKEVWALWRPRSTVKITRRFYRFGSMNMLITLGTTIAYFSSLAELIVAATRPSADLLRGGNQMYFDSVVFLTMFLLLGRLAEAHMKAKSGDAISALGKLRPTEANLVVNQTDDPDSSSLERVPIDLIDTGDSVRVHQGSNPPCDGVLIDETAEFDEASLTGESRLIRKVKGDSIFSGTINKGSSITIKVTSPAGASMLDSIIQVVREGQSKRAPMERIADLLTAYFVPVVVAIAIVTWIIWLALGLSGSLPRSYLDSTIGGWEFWSLQFAIAVFVIACPCGLGLAAPTALFVGGGLAAKRGILVKGGGEAFQEASNLDAVIFDKTGTLTEGIEPKIVQHRIINDDSTLDEGTLLGVLKSMEENSGHPLARAAVAFCADHQMPSVKLLSVDEIAGRGLKGVFSLPANPETASYEALVGNEDLMRDCGMALDEANANTLESWKRTGYSVILLAYRIDKDWQLGGMFAAADPLRPEASEVVKALQARHVDVWMLSGDNQSTARAVGALVGIPAENVIAGVLPAQKADKVRDLQVSLKPRRGRGFHGILTSKRTRATVAMVGDGINDAPALAAADVGIAVASGSDVAVQSAAFVLVQSDLRAVLTLVTLSRVVFRRVILNFFWAAIYNLIALPIAAGVLYPITTGGGTHVRLDPAWAALAMALSSITVVGSSLLLRAKIPWIGFRE